MVVEIEILEMEPETHQHLRLWRNQGFHCAKVKLPLVGRDGSAVYILRSVQQSVFDNAADELDKIVVPSKLAMVT